MMKRLSTLYLLAVGFFPSEQAQQVRPLVLDSVCAPLEIAIPPFDAYIDLSLLDNDGVRHYDCGEQAVVGAVYLLSTDHSLTRKRVNRAKEMPFADRQSPVSKEYIRLVDMGTMGVCYIRTSGESAGRRTPTKVADRSSIMIKSPVFIKNGKRIVVTAHRGVTPKGYYTYISDDDGLTWKCSSTITPPDHRGGGFHKGIRWNHDAVEPAVAELRDGTLWILMRTLQDHHYQVFSQDGGLTRNESEPSPFYDTIMIPTLDRLADGRLLLLRCNTAPPLEKKGTNDVRDDVFTGRGVIHVAASDSDGKTWIGFRKLYTDSMRNDSDYAVNGGGTNRSIHQAQFVEVAPNKMLVSIGQHLLHRATMMFGVNRLYEKSRFNNFGDPLSQWSTFNYVDGAKGHCVCNRMQRRRLEPHPEKEGCQVFHSSYQPDASSVVDTRGAVRNSPAAKKGVFTASLCISEGSHSASLLPNDRWMNPPDTVARHEPIYELPPTHKQLGVKDDRWHEVSLEWDLSQKRPRVRVWVDGRLRSLCLPLRNKSQSGASCARFIAPSVEIDLDIYPEWVRAEADGTIQK